MIARSCQTSFLSSKNPRYQTTPDICLEHMSVSQQMRIQAWYSFDQSDASLPGYHSILAGGLSSALSFVKSSNSDDLNLSLLHSYANDLTLLVMYGELQRFQIYFVLIQVNVRFPRIWSNCSCKVITTYVSFPASELPNYQPSSTGVSPNVQRSDRRPDNT